MTSIFLIIRNSKSKFSSRTFSTKISIPKKIPRGPTDILRTLESSIDRDPTAAHYKYHDDPFLIPRINYTKRIYAMAQESGRKTAHWVREQHPELFQHKDAEPFIKSFAPKIVFTENSNVNEEDLLNAIDEVQVSDAAFIYKLLTSKGIDVSQETQISLFELLCFYNEQDALSDEFIEEKWYRQTSKEGKEHIKKTWKDGSLAEEIFISLDNPPPEAYSAIIQGMAKYYQADRAFELFEEAKEKGFILNADVYNSILKIVPVLKEGYDLRWSLVTDILNQLSKAKLQPNLGTLNSVLKVLSTMGGGQIVKDNMLKTLAEFKKLGIEPSLASWYYMLITFCKDRGPKSGLLLEIMKELENKELSARDPYDTNFFVTGMEICRYHLNSKDAAEQLHKILMYKNNYDLIGDSYKESIYYRHYTSILCTQLPIEEFMKNIYAKIIPHIYIPEPSVLKDILDSIDATAAIEFIPKLWQDIVAFDYVRRVLIVEAVSAIMAANPPSEGSELHEQFAIIAKDILQRIDNKGETEVKQNFSGEMFGNLMTILFRDKDFDTACNVLKKLKTDQADILGVPKIEDLKYFIDQCLENKAPTQAIDCIEYAADSGYAHYGTLAEKVVKSFTLDENHLDRLSKIVGPDILHQKETVTTN